MDVSNWFRSAALTCADRLFCHVCGQSGHSSDQLVPGWPYSFVAALPGASSWTPSVLAPATMPPRSPQPNCARSFGATPDHGRDIDDHDNVTSDRSS
ncbi:transposase [Streptomyces sp. NBC_01799]|nr:transposase [Streptomyces sp. NBC_01800]WSA80636.1 transposase [Streptomyces sp. NBC_01799]